MLAAYTDNMGDVNSRADRERRTTMTPCLCAALRQAARAVTRLYDAELRGTGLRVTQFTLLCILSRSGEVRQGELGKLASIDETTLTRSLRPLEKGGWVSIRAGSDRREKRVAITKAGAKKLGEARLAWSRAQERMRRVLPGETWTLLLEALPDVTQRASKTTSGEAS
ncbi:MAG: MarR family winged helix-turn-helix transcriptional regulator [Isosphaeraceae bacterium]